MALFKPFDMRFIRDSKPSILREKTIDLSSARTNEELKISGDFIHVLDQKGKLEIRLNEEYAPKLDLRKIKRITSPFYRLFLTNDAQTYGSVKLIVGTDAALKFEERRTSHTTILKEDDTTLAVSSATSYTLDLAGYKNISVYFDANKNCTVFIYCYPENSSVISDYIYAETIAVVADNRTFNRIIDFPVGATQISIYNEDSADTVTFDLIVMGEK